MNASKRLILSLVLALLVGGLVTNVAFAFHCSNPNQNENALVGEFDESTLTFTPYKDNGSYVDIVGGEIRINGAWVKIIPQTGDPFTIFIRGVLPDGAMNAGPGDNLCDGKGIDDLEGCP
jgi:hypothetical protein